MKIKRLFASIIAILLLMTINGAYASPRFTGERINANPEQMKAEHEEYVVSAIKAVAQFAVDDANMSKPAKFVETDSAAYQALKDYDGGWFPEIRKVGFANECAENFTGDNKSTFECDCRMECIVKFKKGEISIYDIAYHCVFTCTDPSKTDEKRWKMTDFYNIAVPSDSVDTEEYSARDEGLTLEMITGRHCKGYMLIIDDPSRVSVGTISQPFGNDKQGWQLDKFYSKYGATAVLNGGGFADPNGMGKGGQPCGIVVTQGKQLQAHSGGTTFGTIIGFDKNDTLIARSDIERGDSDKLNLRDAVAFNPVLIQNGERTKASYEYKYLSCRTAIGQREDGTVLMLVVDGRQPDSFGANFGDLVEIMLEYGAVTAANLDGGTSSALVLFGDKINDGTSPDYVSRYMPTAFIVK